MKTVSVVIPCFNRWDLCHALLFDLYNFNRDVSEVVVVDDASTDPEVLDGFQWWTGTKMLPVSWIELSQNVGFLRACNKGVEETHGDIVLLISTDVQIRRPILDEVRRVLENMKCIVGGRLLDYPTGWNNFKGKVFPYLEGWFLGFTREAWKDIGGFDERYSRQDMEDVDFSTTAMSKGYNLSQLEPTGLIHLGAQSIGYNITRESNTVSNRELFRQKWNLEYDS